MSYNALFSSFIKKQLLPLFIRSSGYFQNTAYKTIPLGKETSSLWILVRLRPVLLSSLKQGSATYTLQGLQQCVDGGAERGWHHSASGGLCPGPCRWQGATLAPSSWKLSPCCSWGWGEDRKKEQLQLGWNLEYLGSEPGYSSLQL